MTTIEDEEFFLFFFYATLGIMCRLKWVVAALRVLWPRGTFWLMELMLTLGGSLGFPLVFQFFWASWFLKLPQIFSPLLLRHTCSGRSAAPASSIDRLV